ncbi:MAG: hypothetical protein HQM08_29200 [Candidatus Riflebacteria bacterium]|nr:hypothetical protein [Candidatus Riflebacteria bacterium]
MKHLDFFNAKEPDEIIREARKIWIETTNHCGGLDDIYVKEVEKITAKWEENEKIIEHLEDTIFVVKWLIETDARPESYITKDEDDSVKKALIIDKINESKPYWDFEVRITLKERWVKPRLKNFENAHLETLRAMVFYSALESTSRTGLNKSNLSFYVGLCPKRNCGKLFKKDQSNQEYCSKQCGNALRAVEFRKKKDIINHHNTL